MLISILLFIFLHAPVAILDGPTAMQSPVSILDGPTTMSAPVSILDAPKP